MVTAYVLSGGGSLGAVQVGMLMALAERDVRPDLLVGTSAGAVNAAYLGLYGADAPAIRRLGQLWRGLRRSDVFPIEPLGHLRAVRGSQESLFTSSALRRLLDKHLGDRRLEDTRLGVHVVATDLLSGDEVALSQGGLVDAVLASTAIPGVLPSVPWEGRALVDGGLADNTAISQAVAQGADRVYVLPAGYACALTKPPTTALGTAVQALTLLIHQRLVRDVQHFSDRAEVRVLPPLCPLRVSPIDFRRGADLISAAEASSRAWLDSGGTALPHPERFLALHRHAAPAPRRSAEQLADTCRSHPST
jgi:NTE family protein